MSETSKQYQKELNRDLLEDIRNLSNSGIIFSDLKIEEDMPIMIRTPKGWTEVQGFPPVDYADFDQLMTSYADNVDWDNMIKENAIDTMISDGSPNPQWRYRINLALSQNGLSRNMIIRKIPRTPRDFAKLGLPIHILQMTQSAASGLILITGPAGSGKTSTMAAIVDWLSKNRAVHIVTIEDPIEYEFKNNKAIFTQRQVGLDTKSFYTGAKDALRQRPDVIVIGEIRDKETAKTAVEAAESGILVIGTMHATGSIPAVQKLLGWADEQDRKIYPQILGTTLAGIVSQLLIPNIDASDWICATEILRNDGHRLSNHIDDPIKLKNNFAGANKSSMEMIDTLQSFVHKKLITKKTALNYIAPNMLNELAKRLEEIKD